MRELTEAIGCKNVGSKFIDKLLRMYRRRCRRYITVSIRVCIRNGSKGKYGLYDCEGMEGKGGIGAE